MSVSLKKRSLIGNATGIEFNYFLINAFQGTDLIILPAYKNLEKLSSKT